MPMLIRGSMLAGVASFMRGRNGGGVSALFDRLKQNLGVDFGVTGWDELVVADKMALK